LPCVAQRCSRDPRSIPIMVAMSDGYISVSSLANITYLCTRHQRSKDIPKGLHRITDKVKRNVYRSGSASTHPALGAGLLLRSCTHRKIDGQRSKGIKGGQTFKGSFGSIVPSQGGNFPHPRRITQPPRFPGTPVRSLVCFYCVAVSQAKRPKGPPASSTHTAPPPPVLDPPQLATRIHATL
jgi:hypothetical protein